MTVQLGHRAGLPFIKTFTEQKLDGMNIILELIKSGHTFVDSLVEIFIER